MQYVLDIVNYQYLPGCGAPKKMRRNGFPYSTALNEFNNTNYYILPS